MQVGNFANEVPGQVEHFQLGQAVQPGNLGIEYLAGMNAAYRAFLDRSECVTGKLENMEDEEASIKRNSVLGAVTALENSVFLKRVQT